MGLIVGFLTPLTSRAVSEISLLPLLPQIVIELSAYGLVAGILRKRFNLRVIWALLDAMIAGCLAVLVIYLIAGEVYDPPGL